MIFSISSSNYLNSYQLELIISPINDDIDHDLYDHLLAYIIELKDIELYTMLN